MKTAYYKLVVEGGVPLMVIHSSGDWVRRENHDWQVEGLVSELAEKEKLIESLTCKPPKCGE
jgi:hypothetical protein